MSVALAQEGETLLFPATSALAVGKGFKPTGRWSKVTKRVLHFRSVRREVPREAWHRGRLSLFF